MGLLNTDDLQKVLTAVHKARRKWMVIGLALGLSQHVLENIEGKDNQERLMKMLTVWLKQPSLSPSWEALVQALKATTVAEEGVACEIERQHLKARSNGQMDREQLVEGAAYAVLVSSLIPAALVTNQKTHLSNTWWSAICFRAILISIAVVIVLAVLTVIIIAFPIIGRSDHKTICDLSVPSNAKPNSTIGPNDLPIIPRLFIGRDEDVEKITNILLGMDKPWVRVVCVYGPPAVGKSILAVHVGYEMARRGTMARYINMNDLNHFFEDQDSSDSSTDSGSKPVSHDASSSLAKSMTGIRFPVFMSKKQNYVRLTSIALLEWSNSLKNNTLLIIDNCDELLCNEETGKRYEKFLESLSKAPRLRIVTTHQHRVCDTVVGFGYPLSNLSDKYAVELLHMKTTLSQEQAETIAELVENNPLALHVVGSLINNNVPATVVIRELKDKLLDTLSPKIVPPHQRVRTVLEISIQYLHTDYHNCACILTVFPGSFSEDAGRAVVKDHEANIAPEQCLINLVDLSLLDHYWYAEKSRYQFHRLIKEAFASFCIRVCLMLGTHIALGSYLKYYSQLLLEIVNKHSGDPDNDEIAGMLKCDVHNFHLMLETIASELSYTDDEVNTFYPTIHEDLGMLPQSCVANTLEAICLDRDSILALVYSQKQLVTLTRWLTSTTSGYELVSSNSDVALGLKTLVATTVDSVYDCPKFCYVLALDSQNSSAVTSISYRLHRLLSCYIDCIILCSQQRYIGGRLITMMFYTVVAVCLHPCVSRMGCSIWLIVLVLFLFSWNHFLNVPVNITQHADSQVQSLDLEAALKVPIINIFIIRTAVIISPFNYLDLAFCIIIPVLGLLLYSVYYPLDPFNAAVLNALNLCVPPVFVSMFVKWEEETAHNTVRLMGVLAVLGYVYRFHCLCVLTLPILLLMIKCTIILEI